jgi:hypothetical protein
MASLGLGGHSAMDGLATVVEEGGQVSGGVVQ